LPKGAAGCLNANNSEGWFLVVFDNWLEISYRK
jgi:hypothetical protein